MNKIKEEIRKGVERYGGMKKEIKEIKEEMRRREKKWNEEREILGGDFNAKTGRDGEGVGEMQGEWEEKKGGRISNDRRIDKDGVRLMGTFPEVGDL